MTTSVHEGQMFSEKAFLEGALRGVLVADGPSAQEEDLIALLHRLLLAERIQISLRLIQLEDALKRTLMSAARLREAERARGTRERGADQVPPFISERERPPAWRASARRPWLIAVAPTGCRGNCTVRTPVKEK